MDNVERIRRFTEGLDEHSFARDDRTLFAVKHALLIISEAAQKRGNVAIEMCPDIRWPAIRGIGNHLRHGYDTVDVSRIWRIVEDELTPLRAACEDAARRLRGRRPA